MSVVLAPRWHVAVRDALSDPADAREQFAADGDASDPEVGGSRAHTDHWLATVRQGSTAVRSANHGRADRHLGASDGGVAERHGCS